MNIKKILINTIIIFGMCSLIHFGYDVFPNFLISLFCPVNESIFEHLKMIFTATVLFSFISNIFYKDKNIFFISYFRSMATIIILLILYLPTYYVFGEVMILTLIILFISILISEIFVSKIKIKKQALYINIASAFLLIFNFIMFAILTYYPPKMGLFLDNKYDKYGIDIPKSKNS